MNEDRKKRGLTSSKFLTAVVVGALLINGNNALATQALSNDLLKVSEQLQVQTITGLVVDTHGEPVIGASVVEKGTTNGIVTDLDGKFTLNVKLGAIIQVSFVGYQTQEVKAVKTMKITLVEDTDYLMK